MAKKNRKNRAVATSEVGHITRVQRQVAWEGKLADMRDGRVRRTDTFGGPKNRRDDRRKSKNQLRNMY